MQTTETAHDAVTALINPLHLEDLRNDLHPSLFDENPTYDMLIVRLPIVGETFEIHASGFVLTGTQSYFYDKTAGRFEPLGERFDGPYRTLDPLLDRLLKRFALYLEQIADLEERLYADRTGENFMTQWLGLKRDLVRIERVMLRTADTLQEVVGHYADTGGFPVDNYADLHEHADRVARSATLQLAKLDYIYNFYNARINERMNRIIYLLTVISAIFLPLNLVVGFFGMNTGGLPFAQSEAGTLSAVALMGSLLLVTGVSLFVWQKRDRHPTE